MVSLQINILVSSSLQPNEHNENAFAKLVRTVQLIKKWASRTPESDLDRKDSFLKKFTMTSPNIDSAFVNHDTQHGDQSDRKHEGNIFSERSIVFNPGGNVLYYWLFVVTIAVLYNIFLLIARETFDQLQDKYLPLWLTLDYLCDLVYVGDMAIQFLTGRCEIISDWF